MKNNLIIGLIAAASLMVTTPLMAKGETSHHRAEHTKQMTSEASQKIDINTASASQLAALKHVGEKKAAAIVAYRNAHGNFKAIDDLTKIKGISQRIVTLNKSMLSLSQ